MPKHIPINASSGCPMGSTAAGTWHTAVVLYYFEHFAASRVTAPRGEGEIGRVPGHFRRRRTYPTVTYIVIFLPAARSPQSTYPPLYGHFTEQFQPRKPSGRPESRQYASQPRRNFALSQPADAKANLPFRRGRHRSHPAAK